MKRFFKSLWDFITLLFKPAPLDFEKIQAPDDYDSYRYFHPPAPTPVAVPVEPAPVTPAKKGAKMKQRTLDVIAALKAGQPPKSISEQYSISKSQIGWIKHTYIKNKK